MRFTIFLLFFAFSCAQSKNRVKALTESLGQEVIEIGAPVKELPPNLDEEPSAESDEDEKPNNSAPSITKRETRRTTTLASVTPKVGNERRSEDGLSSDDEEKRIEKELSEIYKDTDYKAESTNIPSTKGVAEHSVEVLRQRGRANFKFQPDVNDRADVERFRTSVDDISCEKRVTQRLQEMVSIVVLEPGKRVQGESLKQSDNSTVRLQRSIITICLAFLCKFLCQ